MEAITGIVFILSLCSFDAAIALMLTDIFDDIEAKENMEWNSSKQYIERC